MGHPLLFLSFSGWTLFHSFALSEGVFISLFPIPFLSFNFEKSNQNLDFFSKWKQIWLKGAALVLMNIFHRFMFLTWHVWDFKPHLSNWHSPKTLYFTQSNRTKFQKVCSEVAWDLWHSLFINAEFRKWCSLPYMHNQSHIGTCYPYIYFLLSMSSSPWLQLHSQLTSLCSTWNVGEHVSQTCVCERERVDMWSILNFGHTSKVSFQFCKV